MNCIMYGSFYNIRPSDSLVWGIHCMWDGGRGPTGEGLTGNAHPVRRTLTHALQAPTAIGARGITGDWGVFYLF